MTPTGDGHVSIAFGAGIPMATPGSFRHLELVTSDIVATRQELVERGVDVTEVYHGARAPAGPRTHLVTRRRGRRRPRAGLSSRPARGAAALAR